ncbi:DUF5681 domain-containing protein [Sphingomonas sp. SRS2]|uniref:DUF5681 domain-containing protein n=1 Tax=Sphingomonas sp. SRS2 TaxID=133190 RepID=UPI0006184630|nr:DUF5681 domain-containing protein [Sphingomonas sp. SRS2]KKC26078.1 hypothetical protein WP12_10765 [Sphingomonas sp. SRS2]
MSDEYEVGYRKPPRSHQFGPGNKAAAGGKKRTGTLSLPEILGQALNRRRKIKRGDQVVSMKAAEIMMERFVHMMTTGSPRELIMMIGLVEKHAPRFFEQEMAHMKVTYHQAEGSSIAPPPAELWEKKS